jgi:predicted aspartyl protease
MKYPYTTFYRPPFPSAQIVLHNSEKELQTTAQSALLDTGSDGSLVPIAYLRGILAFPLTDTYIRSHWGERRAAQLFAVDIEINGLKLPGIFVVGDEQGDEIILGRNVLNKLRLLLDGPGNVTELLSR